MFAGFYIISLFLFKNIECEHLFEVSSRLIRPLYKYILFMIECANLSYLWNPQFAVSFIQYVASKEPYCIWSYTTPRFVIYFVERCPEEDTFLKLYNTYYTIKKSVSMTMKKH